MIVLVRRLGRFSFSPLLLAGTVVIGGIAFWGFQQSVDFRILVIIAGCVELLLAVQVWQGLVLADRADDLVTRVALNREALGLAERAAGKISRRASGELRELGVAQAEQARRSSLVLARMERVLADIRQDAIAGLQQLDGRIDRMDLQWFEELDSLRVDLAAVVDEHGEKLSDEMTQVGTAVEKQLADGTSQVAEAVAAVQGSIEALPVADVAAAVEGLPTLSAFQECMGALPFASIVDAVEKVAAQEILQELHLLKDRTAKLGHALDETAEGLRTALGRSLDETAEGLRTALGHSLDETAEGLRAALGHSLDENAEGLRTALGRSLDETAEGLRTALGHSLDETAEGLRTTLGRSLDETAEGLRKALDASSALAAGEFSAASVGLEKQASGLRSHLDTQAELIREMIDALQRELIGPLRSAAGVHELAQSIVERVEAVAGAVAQTRADIDSLEGGFRDAAESAGGRAAVAVDRLNLETRRQLALLRLKLDGSSSDA